MKRLIVLLGVLFLCPLALVSCGERDPLGALRGQGTGEQSSVEVSKDYAKAILDEHNYVRTRPREYAEEVIHPIVKQSAAMQELYDELVKREPVGALSLDEVLNDAAQGFANMHVQMKGIGHVGPDGKGPGQRINDAMRGRERRMYGWGENCSYGVGKHARNVMIQLLEDDRVEGRGHRKNILNGDFTHVGVGFCDKPGVPYGSVTVLDYATFQK